jgi:hypothetical protein
MAELPKASDRCDNKPHYDGTHPELYNWIMENAIKEGVLKQQCNPTTTAYPLPHYEIDSPAVKQGKDVTRGIQPDSAKSEPLRSDLEIGANWDFAAKLPPGEKRTNKFNHISDDIAHRAAKLSDYGADKNPDAKLLQLSKGVNGQIQSDGGVQLDLDVTNPDDQKLKITHYRPLTMDECFLAATPEGDAELKARGMKKVTTADGHRVTMIPEAPPRLYSLTTGEYLGTADPPR